MTMREPNAGAQRSLFTPSDEREASVADWCAMRLAQRFYAEYQEQGCPARMPDDLDTVCLAMVLLVSEHHVTARPQLMEVLRMCQRLVLEHSSWARLEALPFGVALRILGEPSDALIRLRADFTNNVSGVRAFVFDIAWMCRRHVCLHHADREAVFASLLLNVENTLGYWERSLGLCRHLYTSKDEFWEAVERYQPISMPDQYYRRIAAAKEHLSEIEYPPHLIELELRVRRLIDETVLGNRR